LIDDSASSEAAARLLQDRNIDFLEYDIRNFEKSCCGDLPTTMAPSVFAPEGVFKGLEGVQEYVLEHGRNRTAEAEYNPEESESAY
jgi:hypothetical protein